MGCGIHGVLQKLTWPIIEGNWTTIDVDVLQFPSSMARTFNELSREFRTEGFPERNFYTTSKNIDGSTLENHHKHYWMGDHSFGYFTLEEFCNHKIETYPNVEIQETELGYTIDVGFKFNSYEDSFVKLQESFMYMFYDLSRYRMVVGYDS